MRKFELKEEHILLLGNMYVSWQDCEFGAPEINPKRPYGNSSVLYDMLAILGLKKIKNGIYTITLFNREYLLSGEDGYVNLDEEEIKDTLHKLHKGTQTALQIILHTMSFIPGTYEAEDYTNNWKLVDGR